MAPTVGVVSIPKRVSEALKHYLEDCHDRLGDVSIPKRVSEALKQGDSVKHIEDFSRFQSLKGFQRL